MRKDKINRWTKWKVCFNDSCNANYTESNRSFPYHYNYCPDCGCNLTLKVFRYDDKKMKYFMIKD